MFRRQGALESYMYYPDKDPREKCGADWLWNRAAVPGEWYNIVLFVQVNTPGELLVNFNMRLILGWYLAHSATRIFCTLPWCMIGS